MRPGQARALSKGRETDGMNVNAVWSRAPENQARRVGSLTSVRTRAGTTPRSYASIWPTRHIDLESLDHPLPTG